MGRRGLVVHFSAFPDHGRVLFQPPVVSLDTEMDRTADPVRPVSHSFSSVVCRRHRVPSSLDRSLDPHPARPEAFSLERILLGYSMHVPGVACSCGLVPRILGGGLSETAA